MDLDNMLNNELSKEKHDSAFLVKLERENLTAYARQYINQSDPMFYLADKIKPLEGFEDFMIHGKPDVVEYKTTNGQWVQLTPEDFADTLKMMMSIKVEIFVCCLVKAVCWIMVLRNN